MNISTLWPDGPGEKRGLMCRGLKRTPMSAKNTSRGLCVCVSRALRLNPKWVEEAGRVDCQWQRQVKSKAKTKQNKTKQKRTGLGRFPSLDPKKTKAALHTFLLMFVFACYCCPPPVPFVKNDIFFYYLHRWGSCRFSFHNCDTPETRHFY